MSNRPCILHTRRYRAVYEGLVNTLRESQALQPQQLAQLKELQAGLCSCIAQELLLPDAGDAAASSACFPAAAPAAEGPPAAQQPGSSSALQGAQAQLLHLAQRQGADAEAVMATAARHLGSVVVRVAQTSEQQLVRKKEARRAARDAEDWMYAVATPVVKRRGGARRGGPFGRPVAGRLTSTCMGRACADARARGAALALALPAYYASQHWTQSPRVPAAPTYGSAAVLDLSELLEAKLQLRRGKHSQQPAWRKRQGGWPAATDAGGDDAATAGAAAAGVTSSAGQVLGQGHMANGVEPMDVITDGMCAISIVGCGAAAAAVAAGPVGMLERAGSAQMACACCAE